MILTVKNQAENCQVENLLNWIKSQGLSTHISRGETETIIGLIGDTTKLDIDLLRSLDVISSVTRIQEAYKNANRKFHPENTVVNVGGHTFGNENFPIIAGPCSVESFEQVLETAKAVKASGATILRGGAFKPRTSPYSFQGLGCDGLEILRAVRKETGMPIITEITSEKYIDEFEDVDIIQVGARNMQNFELLKALGRTGKKILLKRGLSATIEELLMSAEYLMAGGATDIILCERGIRTFEPMTRNTLDLSAIPLIKEKTHLPVIVDPSHATGIAHLVKPMAMAAAACGADGLMVEVHNDPARALCDGAQSLTPAAFADMMDAVNAILPHAFKR